MDTSSHTPNTVPPTTGPGPAASDPPAGSTSIQPPSALINDLPIDAALLSSGTTEAPRILVVHERRPLGLLASLLGGSLLATATFLASSPLARLRSLPPPTDAAAPTPPNTQREPALLPSPSPAEASLSASLSPAPSQATPTPPTPINHGPTIVEIEPLEPAPDDSRPLASIHLQTPLLDRLNSGSPPVSSPDPAPPLATTVPAPGETERAWAEIDREAEHIAADRRRLDALKPVLLDENARERQRLQYNQRLQFLDRLRQVAADPGAGLEALASAAAPPRELEFDAAPRQDALARSRQLRAAWIARLRDLGTPEPAILDEIARALARNANARGGPRTRIDALRRASAELLAVPVGPPPPLAIDQPHAVRPATAYPSTPTRPSAPSSSAHGRSRRRTSG